MNSYMMYCPEHHVTHRYLVPDGEQGYFACGAGVQPPQEEISHRVSNAFTAEDIAYLKSMHISLGESNEENSSQSA